MLAIENGDVFIVDTFIQDGVVLIEGGIVQAAGPRKEVEIPGGTSHLDARGGTIVPGFIDMHTNGALGYELANAELADLEKITGYLPQQGVTAFVPTIVSAAIEDILQGLELARQAMSGPRLSGAEILGVHIEGPYINREMRGAHNNDIIRNPDPDEYGAILEYPDVILWVTLAPELPGALELIRVLRENDILVSAGHTMALEQDIEMAVEAGLSNATHLYGNMTTLQRENITRVAGLVEYTLLDDRLTTQIIADGYTFSPNLMKLAYKIKGADKLAIITDNSPLAGLPPGVYNLWGVDVVVEEEISYLPDRSAYAGCITTMDRCLRNAIHLMDVPLGDALRMVSTTPASILGVADRKGSLEPGKDADVTVLNSELEVIHTITSGQLAFSTG
ncbi:MAG: N-acetylglucosamine-6-phosphate deacetylase [Chloroflexota bacterium]|nr:N-acetylglucosamine-6-phosphate deacetylase [Chloroflexota bacterium]